MNRIFVTFLFCELAYVASVRILLHAFTGSLVQQELYWSAIRLVSAAALVWLFRRIRPARSGMSSVISARHLLAFGILLAPVLVGNSGLDGPYRYLYAATSFLVGLREELAYRGVLQNLLIRRLSIPMSLLVSNVLFVGYHFGVQPFTVVNIIQLFLIGIILGFVYHLSGSIVLAVALHSIYDAIWALTPFLARPMPEYVATIIFVLILAALVIANRRPNSKEMVN